MIPHFPNAWLWLGGWDFKYIEGGGRALQAQATVATSTGCCVVSSRTKERPGLWKPSMKEYLKEDTAAGEYTGVGSQSLGIAALSWEPWQAFSGCPMIIFKCRKHPSVCMMEKRRKGGHHRCRETSWESFTVQAKDGLAQLRVVL